MDRLQGLTFESGRMSGSACRRGNNEMTKRRRLGPEERQGMGEQDKAGILGEEESCEDGYLEGKSYLS